jgi:hypothetical protein
MYIILGLIILGAVVFLFYHFKKSISDAKNLKCSGCSGCKMNDTCRDKNEN